NGGVRAHQRRGDTTASQTPSGARRSRPRRRCPPRGRVRRSSRQATGGLEGWSPLTESGLQACYREAPQGASPVLGLLALAQQAVEVDGCVPHRDLAVRVAWPLVLRPVAVELDAVVVGVAEVERLADAVVGRAVEPDPGVAEAAEGVTEGGAGRISDRDVVEPGGARWRG